MNIDNNYGVITEQGYTIGDGMGFKPLNEQDKKHIDEGKEDKKQNDKCVGNW